jgi:uncharacterized membrane protein
MNGDDKPQSNRNIIFIVILTVACCTIIGVTTFAYCMIFNVKPDGVIVTSFASIVTACLGYMAGVLSKTSPTETTKHVDVTNAPTITESPTPQPTP